MEATLEPLLRGVVTTDELPDHVVDDADVAAAERLFRVAERLFRVAERVTPGSTAAVRRGRALLARAVGSRIGDIFR